jgi:3-hydroxybutyryl-CoA dehydrogenase
MEVLVVGPGTMGAGIAQALAQNGFSVGIVGRSEASLQKGLGLIDQSLQEGVAKGVFSSAEAAQIKSRVKGIVRGENLSQDDEIKLVIETISEVFEAKKNLLAELDSFFPPSVALATNTSSLNAEALTSGLTNPERIVWTHFFYPAQKNRTVEYSSLPATSSQAKETTLEILQRARRQVIPLKVYRQGGAANIIFVGLVLEALRLVEEGYPANLIDEASRLAFSTSFGLLSLLQFIGPETTLATALSFSQGLAISEALVAAYDNFFTVPAGLRDLIGREGAQALASFLKKEGVAPPSPYSLVLELARQRFQAVAFMTASEVVQAGLLDPPVCDRLCQLAFGWPEGPFTMMNRLGLEASLQMVTERMELSHRQEINFPVPRNLIERGQKNEPWPLA